MKLVLYGDFNCPYSYLASTRVDVLLERQIAEVEWRAVEHDPAIPQPSELVTGDLAVTMDREVAAVRDVLHNGEEFLIRRPSVHPNTARAVATFAAASVGGEHDLRRTLFAMLWRGGRDIDEPAVLRELLSGDVEGPVPLVWRWREAWLAFDRPVVPLLVLPDGHVSPGLGALTRLEALAAGGPRTGERSGGAV